MEIIFDIQHNEAIDAFLKNIGTTLIERKISLRRSIQSQQIEYYLGETRSERVDIKNFLQLLGFAQSYPFQYAIESNDISTVEMSNDKDRFQWLKNCCGVAEFHSKRDKSLRVLKDTEDQIRKIDGSLAKIDVQLNIFASNENQQIFQKCMLREKELGHFQLQYRIKKLRAEREQSSLKIVSHTNSIARIKNEIIQHANNGTEIRREIKTILDQLNALRANERQIELQIDKYERSKTDLEGSIESLKVQVMQGGWGADLTNREMQIYRDKMDETSTRMSEIDADMEGIDEKRSTVEQELVELESQVNQIVLNCQQNQRLGIQFQSVTQRNEHLSGQIKKMKNAISRENRNVNKFRAELQHEMQELERLKVIASKHNQQLAQMNADDEINSFHQQQQMIESLETQKW